MIQLESVSYTYPNSNGPAIKDVNVNIDKGDYVSFHGTSGSGKSTLLSLLGLINKPSTGAMRLLGKDVNSLTASSVALIKNRELGFIFQNFNLLSRYSVFDNVCLPLALNANIKSTSYKERVLQTLEQVNMADYFNRKPGELSGGQQQRVAIARALVCNPSIILADEPTGNLDSKNSDTVFKILDSLHSQGKTICLITHDQSYAQCAKRHYSVEDGLVC